MVNRRRVTYSSHPNHAARAAHRAGDKQFRTYDTSGIRPRNSRSSSVLGIVLAIVVVIVLVVVGFMLVRGCSAGGERVPDGTQVSIVVPDGASTNSIAGLLSDGGLISSSDEFKNRVKELGLENSLKPGSYVFVGGTSIDDLINQLEAGSMTVSFTVPEGSTISKTADIVAAAYGGAITADQFKAAASNSAAYVDEFPFVADAYNGSLEGFLFPKTYAIEAGDTADGVVRKMLTQYRTEVAALDYSYPEALGLSPYDVVKLASVVEREATADNRATVASVFYNRLAAGMPLQSDATVAYLIDGDPTPEDLQIDSPYNTYLNNGLPAGPICCPGLETLQAVCAPEKTDYLYFYFAPDENGAMKYSFSATYEEHQDAIGGTLG